jgi:hypothetical protein
LAAGVAPACARHGGQRPTRSSTDPALDLAARGRALGCQRGYDVLDAPARIRRANGSWNTGWISRARARGRGRTGACRRPARYPPSA